MSIGLRALFFGSDQGKPRPPDRADRESGAIEVPISFRLFEEAIRARRDRDPALVDDRFQ
jgi:hypothetical protein